MFYVGPPEFARIMSNTYLIVSIETDLPDVVFVGQQYERLGSGVYPFARPFVSCQVVVLLVTRTPIAARTILAFLVAVAARLVALVHIYIYRIGET